MENSLAKQFPEIASEWHPSKNGEILPKGVAAKSNKRYWFMCPLGHEWEAIVGNRTSSHRGGLHRGTGCPFCTGKKVCVNNSLETLFPKVAKEWHPSKNGKVTPSDVVAFSHKKYWFKCSKKHEWESSLAHRANNRGCPYCSNYKVSDDNCLKTTHPNIAKEWHPSKNGSITPRDVLPGTRIKYWFMCENKHEWEVCLFSRTRPTKKTGCPYCLYKTQEQVRDIFQDKLGVFFPKLSPKFLGLLEYDGANEDLKLAFEYDGEFHEKAHHASKNPEVDLEKSKERDSRKDRLSKENGWILIRIHYSQKDNLEQYISKELSRLNLI